MTMIVVYLLLIRDTDGRLTNHLRGIKENYIFFRQNFKLIGKKEFHISLATPSIFGIFRVQNWQILKFALMSLLSQALSLRFFHSNHGLENFIYEVTNVMSTLN
jgi:hypothetical protein